MKNWKLFISSLGFVLFFLPAAHAQPNKTITGKVTDTKNEAVIGATVTATLSDKMVAGTITDTKGNFQISVPGGQYPEGFFYWIQTSSGAGDSRKRCLQYRTGGRRRSPWMKWWWSGTEPRNDPN